MPNAQRKWKQYTPITMEITGWVIDIYEAALLIHPLLYFMCSIEIQDPKLHTHRTHCTSISSRKFSASKLMHGHGQVNEWTKNRTKRWCDARTIWDLPLLWHHFSRAASNRKENVFFPLLRLDCYLIFDRFFIIMSFYLAYFFRKWHQTNFEQSNNFVRLQDNVICKFVFSFAFILCSFKN